MWELCEGRDVAVWKADEPVHDHSSQHTDEELAPYGVGATYQHHLRVERSEMRLGILHSLERHLRTYERVRDHRLHDRLWERCGELPWWREAFTTIGFS